MHRLSLLLAAAVALIAAPAADAATRANWNGAEQRAVVESGVLPRLGDGRFHGEKPLTGAQLGGALSALAAESGQPPVAAGSSATVSVIAFDARVVAQLGLADVAAHVKEVARAAGLQPPRHFGTEVVARQLGLRTNHPAADEQLELFPWEPITRAEAAHSFAVLDGWGVERARAQLLTFALPALNASTRRALRVAVAKIGMPYVWGGEADAVSSVYGYQAHGGYDCSGFVWRVFRLSGHPAGARIGGRTADQMADEIRKRERMRLDEVRPGDLLFFGSSKHADHVGIALSGHWMIHSSSQGVYVSSLDDEWRQDRFTWARRIL